MGIASGVTNSGSTNYTTSVGWQTNHDSDEGVPPPQYIPLHNGPYLILSISLPRATARREVWWDTSLMLSENRGYVSNQNVSFKYLFGISLWDIDNSRIADMLSKAGILTNSLVCDNITHALYVLFTE